MCRTRQDDRQARIYAAERSRREGACGNPVSFGGRRTKHPRVPGSRLRGRRERNNCSRPERGSLARDDAKEKTAGEAIEIVEFLLAYETYGIESLPTCREICPLKDLTPVPCTPPDFVLGIINVRGKMRYGHRHEEIF